MTGYPDGVLADVASIVDCKHRTPEYVETGFPVVRPRNVREEGIDLDGCVLTSASDFADLTEPRRPTVGDLVYSRNASFGVASLVTEDRPFAIGQDVCLIVARQIHPSYLWRTLNSKIVRRQLDVVMSGSTFKRVNLSEIRKLRIPLPPLPEQRRIADILDRADAVRRKRKEAIALTEELLRATFLDMFGDPVTNPKGWPMKPLGELLANIDSGWSPVCETRPSGQGEWGVLKLGAVTFGRYDASENKALPPNEEPLPELEVKARDILFARKNTYEHVAACVFVTETPPRLMLPDLVFRLVLSDSSEVLPEVLWGTLSSPRMRRKVQTLASGTSGSMPNISKERLRTVELPVPPLEIQRVFAAILSNKERMRKRFDKAAVDADSLFSSLVHRAFRGELTASESAPAQSKADDGATGQLGLFEQAPAKGKRKR